MTEKKRSAQRPAAGADTPLVVWGQRRPDPDWDRYLAVLVALALREVEDAGVTEAEDG